jgi:sigma-B regulation protein RsbU (phosphoserine phosphatase)
LVLYTDGVTDAQDGSGLLFGEEQLMRVVAGCAGQPADELLQNVLQAVGRFAGDTEQADDLTCVVVKKL